MRKGIILPVVDQVADALDGLGSNGRLKAKARYNEGSALEAPGSEPRRVQFRAPDSFHDSRPICSHGRGTLPGHPGSHRPRSASRPSPSQSSADCVSGLDGRVLHPNLGDRAPHRLLCPACAPRSLTTRSPDHIGRQCIVELAYAHLGKGFCRSSAPSQKLAQAEKLLDIPAPTEAPLGVPA